MLLHSSHCLKFFIYGGVLGNVPSFTLTCQLLWSLSLYRQAYHLRVHGSNTLALSTRNCYATVFHSLGSCKFFAPPQCSSALGVWIVTERCSEYKTRGYAQRLQRWICQLTECRWHFKSVTPERCIINIEKCTIWWQMEIVTILWWVLKHPHHLEILLKTSKI